MRCLAVASVVRSGTEGRVRIRLNDSRIVIEMMEREAAEEIADFNNRLSNIEAEVKGLQETKWLVRVIVGFLFVWALKDFL